MCRSRRAPSPTSGPPGAPAAAWTRRYGLVAARQAEFASWLVGSLRTGLLAVDAESRVVWLSPKHPALRAVLDEGLRGRDLPSRAELELSLGCGATRPIGFTLVPVRDPAGVLRGAALLFRDLTPFERV